MGRSDEMKSFKSRIFISPFLYIGCVAVIAQIIFAVLHIQEANLICMAIALSCFVASMIHTTIRSEKDRRKRSDYILQTMNEIENKSKQNREKSLTSLFYFIMFVIMQMMI